MSAVLTQISPRRAALMRRSILWLSALVIPLLSTNCRFAWAQSQATDKASRETTKHASSALATTPSASDPGERKFRANCGRCHNAPDQLSPRIAGTVLQHMRVRASLSAQDERDILRYLAP
jgi:cytochrome c5